MSTPLLQSLKILPLMTMMMMTAMMMTMVMTMTLLMKTMVMTMTLLMKTMMVMKLLIMMLMMTLLMLILFLSMVAAFCSCVCLLFLSLSFALSCSISFLLLLSLWVFFLSLSFLLLLGPEWDLEREVPRFYEIIIRVRVYIVLNLHICFREMLRMYYFINLDFAIYFLSYWEPRQFRFLLTASGIWRSGLFIWGWTHFYVNYWSEIIFMIIMFTIKENWTLRRIEPINYDFKEF